jgi:hypothetical protein
VGIVTLCIFWGDSNGMHMANSDSEAKVPGFVERGAPSQPRGDEAEAGCDYGVVADLLCLSPSLPLLLSSFLQGTPSAQGPHDMHGHKHIKTRL